VIGTTTFTGDAQVTLDNSGTVGIAAHGAAVGAVAFGNANISTGVAQFVGAAGNGSAIVDNSGTLALAATASALASDGTAAAGAGIAVGLGQRVFGAESASASIDNSGSLSFSGAADAAALTADGDYSGFAQAIARLGAVTFIGVHGVINQSAIGGSALDSLTNSGTIDASVAAIASGTQARAGANVIIGVKQVANGLAGDARVDRAAVGQAVEGASADRRLVDHAIADRGAGGRAVAGRMSDRRRHGRQWLRPAGPRHQRQCLGVARQQRDVERRCCGERQRHGRRARLCDREGSRPVGSRQRDHRHRHHRGSRSGNSVVRQ
jgi:hypothetical protein